MPGVFISYRREDSSGHAGRLFDILSAQFGEENTFMDLGTIEGGDDFTAVIDEKINLSDVLVAVIGNRWLTITEASGRRRLDDTGDLVRREIAKALERGIRVIPVLVVGAIMPDPDDLPDDLRALCKRQAVEIRDAHFRPDAQRLTDLLRKDLRGAIVPSPPVDVAGTWKAIVKYDWGDTYDTIFEFEVDGSEISGIAGFLSVGRTIWDGKIAGNRISFMTKTQTTMGFDQPNVEDRHYYKGIVEGDTIRFTMVTDSPAGEHTPIHFTAARSGNK